MGSQREWLANDHPSRGPAWVHGWGFYRVRGHGRLCYPIRVYHHRPSPLGGR
jgi:hypothetical protein